MDEPFKEGEDASLRLPASMLEKFEAHYADRAVSFEGGEFCRRCGSRVPPFNHKLHATWHKNVSMQLWLVAEWAKEMQDWKGKVSEMMLALGDMLLVQLGEDPSGD